MLFHDKPDPQSPAFGSQNGHIPAANVWPEADQIDAKPNNSLKEHVAQQVSSKAVAYTVEKAAQVITRTPLGGQIFVITRGLWIAQWLALIVAIVLTGLGIFGLFTEDLKILGVLILILAAIGFGVWFLIRTIRNFISRQVARAYEKFQALLYQGLVKASDWPNWYRQYRREKRKTKEENRGKKL